MSTEAGAEGSFENDHLALRFEMCHYVRVQLQAAIDLALNAELCLGSDIRHGSLDDGVLRDGVN